MMLHAIPTNQQGRVFRDQKLTRRRCVQVLGACAALANTATVQAGRWPQEWTDNQFIYHADFRVPDPQRITQEMRDLKSDVPQLLGLSPSEEPVHVYLFHDRKTYEGYLAKYFPTVPARRALYIKQHGAGMVFAFHSGEFMTDLRHESTHAVLHTLLPMVPLWMDEGLAEYFEVDRATRLHGNPHMPEIRRRLKWRHVPELATLEQLEDISQMKGAMYRDAWAWTHFLLHGPPRLGNEFRAYLSDIQRQTPPGTLDLRLRQRYGELADEFRQHFRRMA